MGFLWMKAGLFQQVKSLDLPWPVVKTVKEVVTGSKFFKKNSPQDVTTCILHGIIKAKLAFRSLAC